MTTTTARTTTCPGWCEPTEHWENVSEVDERPGRITAWHSGRRIAWSDKPDNYVQIHQVVRTADVPAHPTRIVLAADESAMEGIHDLTAPDARRLAAALVDLADELDHC